MKLVSTYLQGNLTDYEYDSDNRIVEVKADSECAEYEHRASQDAIQNDIMGDPIRLNSVIARDTEDRENRVELQWYHKNYLDHVYAVSDDNGNLIEHYRYTAFGEPEIYSATGARRNTSAIGNTVMWNTRRYDADNGLYYYKYRHYAANIGRWLGRDPIEEDGGVNLYAFVGNDPIERWDELGFSASFAMGQAGYTYYARPPAGPPGGVTPPPKPEEHDGFHHYGNWGGPGWASGGWNNEMNPLPNPGDDDYLPPVDGRDACYEAHDRCINACPCEEEAQAHSDCVEKCDHGLADCLYTEGHYLEGLMFDTLIPWLVH